MIRRRTDTERALANLRRLNDDLAITIGGIRSPGICKPLRARRRQLFPEPGAIRTVFQEAARRHR